MLNESAVHKIAAAYSVIAISIAAPIPAMGQAFIHRTIDYPQTGVVLGNGWSTISASKTAGICIEFREAKDPSEDRSLDLKRIVDKSQLNKELSVSAEFQAKAISGLGGSAKATFSKSLEVKNESLHMVISASVTQGATFAAPQSLKPGAGG